jgi:HEAT repeat protein
LEGDDEHPTMTAMPATKAARHEKPQEVIDASCHRNTEKWVQYLRAFRRDDRQTQASLSPQRLNRCRPVTVAFSLSEGSWMIAGAASCGITIGFTQAVVHRYWRTRHNEASVNTKAIATKLTNALLVGVSSAGNDLTELVRQSPEAAIEAMTVVCQDSELEPIEWPEPLAAEVTIWLGDELTSDDSGVRSRAIEAAGTLRLRAARPYLLRHTTDSDEGVCIAACRALTVIDHETAIGVLLGVIDEHGPWAAHLLADAMNDLPTRNNPAVRRAEDWSASPALLALVGEVDSPEADRVLCRALDSSDQSVASSAVEAILASDDPVSVEARAGLVRLLTTGQSATRRSAATVLGRLCDPRTAVALAGAVGDSERAVRLAAAEALVRLPNGLLALDAILTGNDPAAVEAATVARWAGATENDPDNLADAG